MSIKYLDISIEYQVTIKPLRLSVLSHEQPATNNQQPITSNQQPITSNQQPATSNQ
jgi:hypothetical protein